MRYVNSKVNWKNEYGFSFECYIGEKSHITQFMVDHKMFPGNKIVAYTEMRPMNKGWNSPNSLNIKVTIYNKIYNNTKVVDQFVIDQGTFCKIMSNVYCDRISKPLN